MQKETRNVGRERELGTRCILATGGAGYIGSHVVVELLSAGYRVVILDNFENADRRIVSHIPEIVPGCDVTLVEGDVRDQRVVEDVLRWHRVGAVIHLAGKKAVAESVADPLLYFHDNLLGAVALLRGMKAAGVSDLVFSSSATVYGTPKVLPIDEAAPTGVTNPYGRTKLVIEQIIDDLVESWNDFRAVSLRYFNPVGAHPSGLIGESPRGIPNNLFPYVAQTATGTRDRVRVFGGDYDTPDGTGVRDFIHVVDLARGHVRAIELLLCAGTSRSARHQRINLGTGRGYSVLEVIDAFSRACGKQIPYEIVARRPGDAAASLADPSLAAEVLGWRAEHDLEAMCRDHWAFQVTSGHLATPPNDFGARQGTRSRFNGTREHHFA
jgi:UDP-glucose 4-epimerase